VLGLITTLLGHDGTDFHAVKVGTDARLEVKTGLQGADYVPLPIDDDGYLQVVNMATDWPSGASNEGSLDTSASNVWVDLISITLEMPKNGIVVAQGFCQTLSSAAGDIGCLQLMIDGVSEGALCASMSTSVAIYICCNGRQAVEAGTITVTLQGKRLSGTGTVSFYSKGITAWGMGA
jgi:hypothetical protein